MKYLLLLVHIFHAVKNNRGKDNSTEYIHRETEKFVFIAYSAIANFSSAWRGELQCTRKVCGCRETGWGGDLMFSLRVGIWRLKDSKLFSRIIFACLINRRLNDWARIIVMWYSRNLSLVSKDNFAYFRHTNLECEWSGTSKQKAELTPTI